VLCFQLSYYGLCFSSYRHVSWFEHEHTSWFVSCLAWLVALACGLGMPLVVWFVLQRQNFVLQQQDETNLGRIQAQLFTFTYSALLDGPLRPSRRRWAVWILLKRNALALAIGVLAVNTVQSPSEQWGLESPTATTIQLVVCLLIMLAYIAFLVWQRPYASVTVNRLQLLYESLSALALVALLAFHAASSHPSADSDGDPVPPPSSDSPWIDLLFLFNVAAAVASFAIFCLMMWETSKPYHAAIARRCKMCRKRASGSGSSGADDEEEEEAAAAAIVVSPLAAQLFPDMDQHETAARGVAVDDSPVSYSNANPPPLPIKRRKKQPAAATAHQVNAQGQLTQTLLV
jgi:hypothetical protein